MYEYHDAPSRSSYPAVPLEFSYARLEDAYWRSLGGVDLVARDLLLGEATSHQLGARLLKAAAAGKTGSWPFSRSPKYQSLYVMAGVLTITSNNEQFVLRAGDVPNAALLAGATAIQWDADFEAFELSAPDWQAPERLEPAAALAGLDLPAGADAAPAVNRLTDNSFVKDGLRPFFNYRDLGTSVETDRRMHLHVVKVVGTLPGGTGWHVHSMSQIFFVFQGWVKIAVEGQGVIHMQAGEAMTIANGMRHNVFEFSPDYELVELCMPADYSTVPTPAPADIAV
jgi:quercetin dioxygenase-like cupin family protein